MIDSGVIPLLRMMLGVANTQMLFAVAKLGIADILRDGAKTVEELAAASKSDVSSLYRVLGALAQQGVFAEIGPRRFTLTPSAELLRSGADVTLLDYVILHGSEFQSKAWPNLLHTVQTGESAFDHTYGMNIYDFLGQHPLDSAMFDDAMTSISRMDESTVNEVYDFSRFRTVVDVGGGRGFLLATILKSYPNLTGILFDLPSVVEGASEFIQAEGLDERCQVIGGDYSVEFPEGGDLYIFKRIFTQEIDESAEAILRNCRNSLSQGGAVLIVEPDISTEYGILYDILMLALTGGQLRSESAYRELLSNAGFRLGRVVGTSSYLSITEGLPV